jgi:hypothetical protein
VAQRTQQESLLDLTHDSIFVRDMDDVIRVQGWIRSISIVFSMPSIPLRRGAWVWGWRSAIRSSRLTEDDCGRRQICLEAPPFSSRCRFLRGNFGGVLPQT